MNRTTLQERIKEEIVLRRGQVKERQWRQTGLPDEAVREGIAADEFRRLVNEVSRQINFEKVADLRRRLEDALHAPPMYQLHQTQEDDFVAEGERLGLSTSFVGDRWIPQLIADLKKEEESSEVAPFPADSSPAPTVTAGVPERRTGPSDHPKPEPPAIEPSNSPSPQPAPTAPTEPPLRERVKTILDEYQGHISARDLRLLFRAMHTDERVLAEEILAYMSANFYASETEPQGATLPEKLLSTDWRHLAWWDKPTVSEPVPAPEPAPAYVAPAPDRTAGPPAPTYVPPVTPTPPASSVPAPKSSNAGLWGAVFAVAVLLVLYLLIKPNQKKSASTQDEEQPERTEQPNDTRPAKRSRTADKPKQDESVVDESQTNRAEENVASDEPPRKSKPVTKPTEESSTVEETAKPARRYDRLLETTGQFGEQPAKLGRKWGLWRSNDWMVYPIYDDITTFRDGRATVVRHGRTYDIDEKGNPIEE